MKASAYKYTTSLLLCGAILSGISCSNESNETQTSANTSTQPQKIEASQNTQALQSTQVALNTQTLATETLAHGEEAHKNHCYKCHTDAVYTRDNRFVKSIDALSKQVVRCKDNTEAAWFDEDAEAVVQFLNQKYYKF